MRKERREQQNSLLKGDHHTSSTIAGPCGYKQTGIPYLNRWMRISLRSQRDKNSVFQNLLTHLNVASLEEAFNAQDGSKALGVDGVSVHHQIYTLFLYNFQMSGLVRPI
jgi:hypothetical protein